MIKKGDNEGGIYTTPKGYSFFKENERGISLAFFASIGIGILRP